MLIEFSVKNFRSFKDRQALSLVKAKGGELEDTNTFLAGAPKPMGLLKSVAVYGPNAGGKSNLLAALKTMKSIVKKSAKNQRGDSLPVIPFLLDGATAGAPSEFEVVFIVDGARYQYGFTASKEQVMEEWLLAYPKGRVQRWFDRAWNEEAKSYEWTMGDSLMGDKQLWQRSTRANALFLSTAVQLNSGQLQPVYDWFDKTLRFMVASALPSPVFTAAMYEEGSQRESVLKFLQKTDIDVHDIAVRSEDLSEKNLPDDMPQAFKSALIEELKGKKAFAIRFTRMNEAGKAIQFDFSDESGGTQKMFSLAGPILDTLENGYVLVVDELHNSLHPALARFLLKMFHSKKTNPNDAQLVFATHETSLLDQAIFRRDQIWLIEKGKSHASELYPLSDFKPRKNREDLEAYYLSGRYGALPYLKATTLHEQVS